MKLISVIAAANILILTGCTQKIMPAEQANNTTQATPQTDQTINIDATKSVKMNSPEAEKNATFSK